MYVINQIWNPEVFRSKGFNDYENIFKAGASLSRNSNCTGRPNTYEMNEINPKYENTRKIHWLLTNQNLGCNYKFFMQ
jgi:hypothetical protein